MKNKTAGNIGEQVATAFLKNKGYEIIHRNFRCRCGEIDIIAIIDEYIVFTEVKYRKNTMVSALYSINKQKQAHIKNAALTFLKLHTQYKDLQIRFDVISIEHLEKMSVDHIENAFR